jgi:hypothetical protein
MLNYPFIILWVLGYVKIVANAFVVNFAATDVGMVVGALGTNIFGLIGPIAIVGLVTATIGVAITSYYFSIVSPLCLGH